MDRARNVLELAVYQLPAEQVAPALELLQRLSSAYQKSLRPGATTKASTRGSADRAGYAEAMRKLKGVDQAIWSDADKLAAHVESLRSLAADLSDEDDPESAELRNDLHAEMERWSEIQRIKARCDYLDVCLHKLESNAVDLGSDMAVSILQAGESMTTNSNASLTGSVVRSRVKIVWYPSTSVICRPRSSSPWLEGTKDRCGN